MRSPTPKGSAAVEGAEAVYGDEIFVRVYDGQTGEVVFEGVERVFQTHSPSIADIKVKRRSDVRRAKLYYLRGREGKSARIKEKLR